MENLPPKPITAAQRRNSKLFGYLAPLFLLGLLAWFGMDVMKPAYLRQKSSKWPATTGQVLATRVEIKQHYNKYGKPSFSTYLPVISFQYHVAGETFTNNTYQLYPGDVDTKSEAEQILRAYVVGATTTVYYNPAAPAESYLVQSKLKSWDVLGMLVYGTMSLALLAGFITVIVLTRRRMNVS
jgi:hypothetical protein